MSEQFYPTLPSIEMPEQSYPESSASAMIPLTALTLSSLKAKKRKRADVEEEGEVSASAQADRRFAPAKKPRKKAPEPTLQQVLGGSAPSHGIPSAFFALPISQNPGEDLRQLQGTVTLIAKCIDVGTEEHHRELRTKIHRLELDNKYYVKDLLVASRITGPTGLRRVLAHADEFAWDIVADADALLQRMLKGGYDASLMKGIEMTKKKTLHYGLEKISEHNKVPANVFGSNGLRNGDWWVFRVCTIRDGAHGAMEGGIYGKADVGAYSVVVSYAGYKDVDNGDTIQYCGTKSNTATPTHCTKLLRASLVNQNPVRVLRAASKKEFYAPSHGIRYDGLYRVTAEEVLDLATAMYRFTLVREPGQDPIRYSGLEKRPTKEQLDRMNIVMNQIAAIPRSV